MTQNFENHVKFVPAFHIVVLGIFTINLGWSLYRVAHTFSAESVISLLLAIAFIRARRTGSLDPTRDAPSHAAGVACRAASSHF
jgi:hypothetical protein